MFLTRRIVSPGEPAAVLQARLDAYPAVGLIGPRQCGKTTLARSLGGRYYDLEQPDERLRLDLEWPDVVNSESLTVLDEVQANPDVFPRLRGAIDADRRRNGRFLLLGSVAPSLMAGVSQSLAGRLGVVELTPLSLGELAPEQQDRLWLCGGFPDGGVLGGAGFPDWQLDYLNLLARRDLPEWGLPARAPTTMRLFRLLAADHARQWNASGVGAALGLSYQTINRYVDRLEDAFLVRRLPAYHPNLRKRYIKRPKILWRDSGLLHALLGVSEPDELIRQPWVGSSWEGHMVEQVLAALSQAGHRFEAYHMRTGDGHELDLLLELGTERWAVETKLTTRPRPSHMARLKESAALVSADRRFLISRLPGTSGNGADVRCDLPGMLTIIDNTNT